MKDDVYNLQKVMTQMDYESVMNITLLCLMAGELTKIIRRL